MPMLRLAESCRQPVNLVVATPSSAAPRTVWAFAAPAAVEIFASDLSPWAASRVTGFGGVWAHVPRVASGEQVQPCRTTLPRAEPDARFGSLAAATELLTRYRVAIGNGAQRATGIGIKNAAAMLRAR